MSRFGVFCIAFLLGAARLAYSQPAEPAPPQPPPQPSGEPPASPPPPPPSPPAHEEAPAPAPEPSVYDQCMAVRHRLAAEADGTDDLKEKTRLLKSMPECTPDMTATSVLSAASSGESAGADGEDDGSGVAVEVRLETGLTLIGSSSALPTTQGGIFFGHRGRTATYGIGIDLGRITQSMTDPSGASGSESVNTVLVMPGVRFVLARSRDEKTELLGQIDVGYGANWQSDDTGSSSPPSVGHFRAQLAPALRYWVSPSFAVGGTGGLRYDRLSQDNAGASMSIATTAMFGSFQLTGVF